MKRSRSAGNDDAAPIDPNMPLIRLEGINKTFKGDSAGEEAETVALDHVTVDIDRGDPGGVDDRAADRIVRP